MNSSSTSIYSKETKKMEVYQFECCKIYNTKTPSNERWKETKHISVKLLNYQPTNLMKLLWLAKKCISSILYLKKPQSRVPRDSKDLLRTYLWLNTTWILWLQAYNLFLFCLKTYHVRMTSYLPYKASLLSSAEGNVLLIKEGLRFHIKSGKTKGIITHIRSKSKWGVFCEIWVKLKRLLPDVQFSIYNSVRGWQTFLQEIPQQVYLNCFS